LSQNAILILCHTETVEGDTITCKTAIGSKLKNHLLHEAKSCPGKQRGLAATLVDYKTPFCPDASRSIKLDGVCSINCRQPARCIVPLAAEFDFVAYLKIRAAVVELARPPNSTPERLKLGIGKA
jgi:hypothetical protein